MDKDFWHERWALKQIGFHQEAIHPLLLSHWPQLGPHDGEGVFVPLCGKTHDMGWLQEQGHPVVGVELSPLAVEQFFAEASLEPVRSQVGALSRNEAGGIALYCGDFFALQPSDVENCRLVYDRASLIALPPAMRRDYVEHLHRLFPNGARILLITVDYPPAEMSGPPFAVTEAEVRELYGAVQVLARREVLDDRMRQRGLSQMYETAYRVELPGR
jgi:thiopurine S-methyltransferase